MGHVYLLPRLDFSGFLVYVKGRGRGAFGNRLTCSVLTTSKMNHTLRAVFHDKQTCPLYLLSQLNTQLGTRGKQEERATFVKKHITTEGSFDETANKISDTNTTILRRHWELTNYYKKSCSLVQKKKKKSLVKLHES